MIRIEILFILAIISIIDGPPPVQGQIQPVPPRVIFNNYIKNYNLKYTLPRGFNEADTITESEIRPFAKKPAPFDRFHFNVFNQSFSTDGNTLIIYHMISVTKRDEEKARLIQSALPNSPSIQLDFSKHYFLRLRGILYSNLGIPSDSLKFNEQDIQFYPSKDLKRLGAEVAGEYTVKLTDPYLDYNYLTFRFIVIPYYLDIYTYIFYKEYSDKIGQEVSRKTRYALRFRNPQANR